MAIEFNCSKCGQRNVVAGTLAGKSVRCRECGAIVRVPGDAAAGTSSARPPGAPPQPSQPPGPPVPAASGDHVDDADRVHPSLTAAAGDDALAGSPSGSSPRPVPRKSLWPVVLVVLAIAGAGIWLANRGKHEAGGPVAVPTARLNTVQLAQTAAAPAYQRLVDCWLSELTINDSDTRRQVALWVYMPLQQKGTPRSVGCVFVAAGGPGMLPGSRLSEDQRDEHVVLAKAGFAVVAYDVEGAVPRANAVGPAAIGPLVGFMAADGGVADGRLAIEYVLRHVPEADPSRLYAAGAGSSGTVALLLAAGDPRIRGCAVRAPIVDLATPLAPYKERLNEMVQDAGSFLADHSPVNRIGAATVPVWVFHAEDDGDVPISESVRLSQASAKVTVDRHAAVGDATRRLEIGRARAVVWLDRLDDKLSGGLRTATRPATRPAIMPTQPITRPRPPVVPVPVRPATQPASQPATRPATRPTTAPSSQPSTQPDSERPGVAPPVDPMRQRAAEAAARLINLGANVRLDPTAQAQTSLLDLGDVADPAKAAENIPALGKVTVVHLTARQATPAVAAALKSLPFIGLLDIDPTNFTDAHLEQFGALGNVEELSLIQASVGPGGLKALAGMTGLKKLSLRAAKIDDAACAPLGNIASLKTLDLSDTRVTNDGIARLKTLKNLVTLRLKNTAVTQNGIDDLRAGMPRLNVIPP
ncbi:MAG: hypothetical protein ACHRHE_13250 [Tepidisphaerales bacterium]